MLEHLRSKLKQVQDIDKGNFVRILRCALISVVCVFMLSCSTTHKNSQDPLEGFNREMFGFNKTLDRALIKPVAYLYLEYVPSPMQKGVGNFFDNLREVSNFANDILQFKLAFAAHDASRFFINSTIGIFGIFDPATTLGLHHRRQDFGQTLYQWGYKNSSYLVLPLLGPTTIRDGLGLGVDYFALSVWPWIEADWRKYTLLTVDYIDLRARLLKRQTVMDILAVDEYIFIRDAYLQHRQYLFNESKIEDNINGETDSQNNDINPYDNDEDNVPSSKAPPKKTTSEKNQKI